MSRSVINLFEVCFVCFRSYLLVRLLLIPYFAHVSLAYRERGARKILFWQRQSVKLTSAVKSSLFNYFIHHLLRIMCVRSLQSNAE